MGFVIRSKLAHALAHRINHTGQRRKSGIYFQKTPVHRLFPLVENHLDGAKAFIDGFEQRAKALFALSQRSFGSQTLDSRPDAGGQFTGQLDLVFPPVVRNRLVKAQRKAPSPVLDQRYA